MCDAWAIVCAIPDPIAGNLFILRAVARG